MHPELSLIAARQHIADLHRAANHYRLVHDATTASSHAVPLPRHAAVGARVSFLDRRGSRDEGLPCSTSLIEEREVALLAESGEDAKKRQPIRRRVNEIQDDWPPQRVSVEAMAVESYPDLE